MKLKNIFLFILISLSFLSEISLAGGWTQKKGKGYYQISSQIIRTDKYIDPTGNELTIPTIGDYTINFYAEYGLTDDLTAVTDFPFFRRITLNKLLGSQSGFEYFAGDSKTGISDFNIGLRYKLSDFGSTVISGALSFGIPVGDSKQKNGLLTGDGELNQFFSIQAGHSFYPSPFYTSGEVGFNNRVKGYSDEIKYEFEIGYNISKKILLILKANGVETLRNGANNVLGGMGGLYANNQRYLNYGPVLNYFINDNIGITAGIVEATSLQNTVSGFAYNLGIFIK